MKYYDIIGRTIVFGFLVAFLWGFKLLSDVGFPNTFKGWLTITLSFFIATNIYCLIERVVVKKMRKE